MTALHLMTIDALLGIENQFIKILEVKYRD